MHGSSSVPQALQDVINRFGGEMPQTYGVPVEEIERGIRHGVRKVNIDTDCRMAMTRPVPPDRHGEPGGVRSAQIPRNRPWMPCAISAVTASSGSARRATPSRIKVIGLDEMAKRYAAGKLDPQIAAAKAA